MEGRRIGDRLLARLSEKSNYSPAKSKLNFAVPNEKILRDFGRIFPKIIPPGKIQCTMDMLKNKNDIVIMGDAKLVTKGLKDDFSGDVNLFGHEQNPNLNELKKYMEKRIDFISDSISKFHMSSTEDKFNTLSDLTDLVTEMVRRVRDYHTSKSQKLVRYNDGNYPTKPDKAISACKTNMYTAGIWVLKSLSLNDKIFDIMRMLQQNVKSYDGGPQSSLLDFNNLHLLHSSAYVAGEIDRNDYPHLIKKYSDEWKEMVRESLITDECISDSLGLNGTVKLNQYIKTFLKEECEPVQFNFSDKRQYELDGIATIANTFLPALLPACAKLYEEGCSFICSGLYAKFMCVSPMCVVRYVIDKYIWHTLHTLLRYIVRNY